MNEHLLWSLRVRAPQACVEVIVNRLEKADEPEALSISAFETRSVALWRVDGLYNKKPRRRDIVRLLAPHLTDVQFEVRQIEPENWVAKTQRDFRPIRAGRFFVSQVSGIHEAPLDTTPLAIEAAQAFGTGHHGSTHGCLLAVDYLAKTRRIRRTLDLGCGTGVLALACSSIWRTPVIASDFDPIATQTTRDNARLNGVHPWITAVCANGFHHRLLVHERFDLILANLLARPLTALAPTLTRHLTHYGVAVLSGLLERQAPRVKSAYLHQQMTLLNTHIVDGWATLTFVR